MAELGIPGVLLLAAFFLVPMVLLWPLTKKTYLVSEPWVHDAARMVIASLTGFVVAAQFVTIKFLEVPFYVVLLGCGVLRLTAEYQQQQAAAYRLAVRTAQAEAEAAPVATEPQLTGGPSL